MNDEKYVVFKREEWDHWKGAPDFDPERLRAFAFETISPLDDAVVIRTQDVFAVSGLRAYRDTMLTHRNLLFVLLEDMYHNDPVAMHAKDLIRNLDAAIAYFTEVTIEAEDRFNRGNVKVPD